MVRPGLLRRSQISGGVMIQNPERFFVIDRSRIIDIGDQKSGQRAII
jgi:hypothetical protein